jgi:hypothetical protein
VCLWVELKPDRFSKAPLLPIEAEEAFRAQFQCRGDVKNIAPPHTQPGGKFKGQFSCALKNELRQRPHSESAGPQVIVKGIQGFANLSSGIYFAKVVTQNTREFCSASAAAVELTSVL